MSLLDVVAGLEAKLGISPLGAAQRFMPPEKQANGVRLRFGMAMRRRLRRFFVHQAKLQRRETPILSIMFVRESAAGPAGEDSCEWEGWRVNLSEAQLLDMIEGHFYWFVEKNVVFFAPDVPGQDVLAEISGRRLEFQRHYPRLVS